MMFLKSGSSYSSIERISSIENRREPKLLVGRALFADIYISIVIMVTLA